MTLHSILPHELVMSGFEEAIYNYEDVTIDGLSMQVEFVDNTKARIIRLYSGNPNDYLNPLYTPGSIIHYVPTRERE
ncbi:MAG: YlzJ-like family protein [Gorillibacterium sp.]|nr:YlzJ-like family protein [Gorillibacterium sp.]